MVETQRKVVGCDIKGCTAAPMTTDEATKTGWFLDPHGNWFCTQHNPNIYRMY